MSGNNVTLTEQGHLVVGNVGIPAAVVPAIEAYYRAKFAAERMPEDVQKLVEEVKRLVREGARRLGYQLAARGDQAWADQMLDAIQRLEAAYSQKGVE